MAFHEVRFPVDIALGATGGPERRTEIITLGSGHEERNARWAVSRRRYNAGYGVRTLDELHDVIAFFEARCGRLHGFRWKDHADWKSCRPAATPACLDQILGVGDGSRAAFLLTKRYHSGSQHYVREIRKPVQGSVSVAVDGVIAAENEDFTLDTTTGIVTFLDGRAPKSGATVTAGFAFDVPVRFDSDHLAVNLAAFSSGDIPDIPIVEIRVPTS
ncbi:MAG: DUF2460 domain-containing protein [Hyphomicrobiales bacterium]